MASPELKRDDERQDRKRNILVIVIVLLVLLNGFFAFNHYRTKKKADHIEAKRNELDSLYAVAMYEIEQAKEKLKLLKGKNKKLDRILAEREKQLEEKQHEIDSLLKRSQLSSIELVSVRKLVHSLRDDGNKYVDEVAKLNNRVVVLGKEKDSLNTTIQDVISKNIQLIEDKKLLNQQVVLGSLLKPENITGIGVRTRSNGQESETNVAKKSLKLKVCFDVAENRIALSERKEIFLKVISPSGATIAVESMGSGILIDAETGEPIQYTTKAAFDYDNSRKNICVYWQQNTAFSKGVYKVKFYQNNFFLNEGSFELK
jgi:hypothetical protein